MLRGKFVFPLFLFLGVFVSCADRKEDEDKQYEEDVIRAIDDKDYERAIHIIEVEIPDEIETTYKFQLLLAQAHYGASGLDTLSVVETLRGDYQNLGNPQQRQLLSNCSLAPLGDLNAVPSHCWMARLNVLLPATNNSHILQAESIFFRLLESERGLSLNNKILLATLKTARIAKRLGVMLESFLAAGDDLSREEAEFIFKEVVGLAGEYNGWFKSLDVLPSVIHEKLTGFPKAGILQDYGDELAFVEETGIPHILEVLDEKNETLEAKLTRISIVQEIEVLVRDYFKVAL